MCRDIRLQGNARRLDGGRVPPFGVGGVVETALDRYILLYVGNSLSNSRVTGK